MRFAFGQVEVGITGDEKFCQVLPPRWQKYRRLPDPTQPAVELNIREASAIETGSYEDGWNTERYLLNKTVFYVQDRKALLALQYQRLQTCATIMPRDATAGCVLPGLQFGLLLALNQQYIGLHGVTLLCGYEIIILSAPSGTGKTTLAGLLEAYRDAIVINGDFALLKPTPEGVIFEPTPFCGSSGRCLNRRLKVDRIVFLEQAAANVFQELSGREAMTRFMSNAFIPTWDRDMQQSAQENILKCVSALKVNAFGFTPTEEAAATLFDQLKHQ